MRKIHGVDAGIDRAQHRFPFEAAAGTTTILGPRAVGLLFRALLLFLPFFLLTAFFCLGMALLQQRRYRLQKFLDLDRFIQNSHIIFSCVLGGFGARIAGE